MATCPPGVYGSRAPWLYRRCLRSSHHAVCPCLLASMCRFGSAPGLSSSRCSGPCAIGRYGNAEGLITHMCSGPCDPGYTCPAGSTKPTAEPCPGAAGLWPCDSGRGGRFIILVVSVFCCRGSCFCCSGGTYGDGISCSGECEVRCRCGIATSCADSPSLPHRCASTGRLLLPTRIVFTSCSAVRWHRLLLPCRVVCTAAGGCWSLHAAFHRCFHHAHRPSPVPRRLLLCGRWPSAHVPCWYLRRGGRCPVVGVFRPVPAWPLRQWLLQPRGV